MIVWLITWRWFDYFILSLIIANSVILGLTDYSSLTPDGELSNSSWRNYLVDASEPVFTGLFTLEAVLKIIGMGFFFEKKTYLRDGWNVLDFIVVVSGLLSTVPGIPNVSAFRTIRVLRPLRSLTVVPGMRLLVSSLLKSIPALLNVVALLLFVFSIFGILGVQLWAGLQHTRCRVTQYPVTISPDAENYYCNVLQDEEMCDTFHGDESKSTVGETDPILGPCGDPDSELCYKLMYGVEQLNDSFVGRTGTYYSSNAGMLLSNIILQDRFLVRCLDDTPNTNEAWSKDSSPWNNPQPCFWPTDPFDEYLCDVGGAGAHTCESDRWCGSNFDNVGNERFNNSLTQKAATYVVSLNW